MLNEILRHFTQYNQANIGSRLKLGYIRFFCTFSSFLLLFFYNWRYVIGTTDGIVK